MLKNKNENRKKEGNEEMLHKLNKDLLVKLLENVNNTDYMTIEEMENRIKTYQEAITQRKRKERTNKVKKLLWELRKVEILKDIIENNREEIEKLEFDFSDVPDDSYLRTKILYKNKFQIFRDISHFFCSSVYSSIPLFEIAYRDSHHYNYLNLWEVIIIYVYNGKWKGRNLFDIENMSSVNDLDWII